MLNQHIKFSQRNFITADKDFTANDFSLIQPDKSSYIRIKKLYSLQRDI